MNHLKIERLGKGNYSIELDGVDISDNLRGLSFGIHRNQDPIVRFEYACHQVEVDDQVDVIHYCPEELRT